MKRGMSIVEIIKGVVIAILAILGSLIIGAIVSHKSATSEEGSRAERRPRAEREINKTSSLTEIERTRDYPQYVIVKDSVADRRYLVVFTFHGDVAITLMAEKEEEKK